MNIKHFVLPAVALGAAAVLLVPERAESYSTLGYFLPNSQRDFRVFNNFSKPQTNNNTVIHPNWPGYDGAELAIWKGCQEWQSELFGTGDGDPTQPFGVGSGGANFDCTWQGNATDVGGLSENTHSQISGSAGGVLAYCEGPGSGGWRIRYYEGWNWQDGPPNEGGVDLQGVACHEYGHALGLGHTNVGGATMYPSISGSGSAQRSIAADDIAGVQAIYGVKDPAKPRITSVSATPGVVTLNGTNFDQFSNEVWFTQAGQGGTGDPVVLSGVASNGTQIVVVPPPEAGPGAVLVKVPGINFSDLSNAFPLTPLQGAPCNVTVYCTGKVNSLGQTPAIGVSGTPSLAVNDLQLTCINGGIPNVNGIHFWSNTGTATIPFANGFVCLAPPTIRGPVHKYDPFGFISVPLTVLPQDVGNTRWFQFWFRDTNHPDGTGVGLSDAVAIQYCN